MSMGPNCSRKDGIAMDEYRVNSIGPSIAGRNRRRPQMNAGEMLAKMGDSFASAATAKSVFGEPVRLEGKVVVPVATVAWGFGAGSGHGPAKHSDAAGDAP